MPVRAQQADSDPESSSGRITTLNASLPAFPPPALPPPQPTYQPPAPAQISHPALPIPYSPPYPDYPMAPEPPSPRPPYPDIPMFPPLPWSPPRIERYELPSPPSPPSQPGRPGGPAPPPAPPPEDEHLHAAMDDLSKALSETREMAKQEASAEEAAQKVCAEQHQTR